MTPDEMILKVVNDYGKINGRHPASYGAFSADGSNVWLDLNGPCHASMDGKHGSFDVFITSYPIKDMQRDTAFFVFMRNYLYPAYADSIALITEPTTNRSYIQITDLDKIPANVLYNMVICSRVIVEWREKLNLWYDLQEAGVHPCLAFVLCQCRLRGYNQYPVNGYVQGWVPYQPYRDRNGRFARRPLGEVPAPTIEQIVQKQTILDHTISDIPGPYMNHWPYDNTVDVRQMMEGRQVSMSAGSYKTAPNRCRPCNVIWGHSSDVRRWMNKTVREVCEMYPVNQQKEAVA